MFGRERCILAKINNMNLTIVNYDMCSETKQRCNVTDYCNNEINDSTYAPICATNGMFLGFVTRN